MPGLVLLKVVVQIGLLILLFSKNATRSDLGLNPVIELVYSCSKTFRHMSGCLLCSSKVILSIEVNMAIENFRKFSHSTLLSSSQICCPIYISLRLFVLCFAIKTSRFVGCTAIEEYCKNKGVRFNKSCSSFFALFMFAIHFWKPWFVRSVKLLIASRYVEILRALKMSPL